MIWSFSAYRTFLQCQRKWFYMQKVANANAKKDPVRREAFLLSQLRTVPAWRGSVVDKTIEEAVVPSLSRGVLPQLDWTLAYARDLAHSQLAFALSRGYLEPDMTKNKAGNQFAALFEVEYQDGVDPNALKVARQEIEASLANLLSQAHLLRTLLHSRWLGAQRALTFSLDHADFSVRANPDLIAFFDDAPPLIIDWKVSTQRTNDYWLQLALYALALSRASPHRDWPPHIAANGIDPTKVRLLEANLLTNHFKEHVVSDDDLVELEELIWNSAWEIGLLDRSSKYHDLEATDFDTARNPRTCESCPFRRICW